MNKLILKDERLDTGYGKSKFFQDKFGDCYYYMLRETPKTKKDWKEIHSELAAEVVEKYAGTVSKQRLIEKIAIVFESALFMDYNGNEYNNFELFNDVVEYAKKIYRAISK